MRYRLVEPFNDACQRGIIPLGTDSVDKQAAPSPGDPRGYMEEARKSKSKR
jgi:hypothetical protein